MCPSNFPFPNTNFSFHATLFTYPFCICFFFFFGILHLSLSTKFRATPLLVVWKPQAQQPSIGTDQVGFDHTTLCPADTSFYPNASCIPLRVPWVISFMTHSFAIGKSKSESKALDHTPVFTQVDTASYPS